MCELTDGQTTQHPPPPSQPSRLTITIFWEGEQDFCSVHAWGLASSLTHSHTRTFDSPDPSLHSGRGLYRPNINKLLPKHWRRATTTKKKNWILRLMLRIQLHKRRRRRRRRQILFEDDQTNGRRGETLRPAAARNSRQPVI